MSDISGLPGYGMYGQYNQYSQKSQYGQYGQYNQYSNNGNVGIGKVTGEETDNLSASELKSLKRAGKVECETCASRKYQDGSDENNVSFKSASHVSPEAASSAVMAHEQQHVSNAYNKASDGDGKVINASVTLKTAVCPECGRSYVSGGVTNTAIKYDTSTKFGQNQKSADYDFYAGKNIDYKS